VIDLFQKVLFISYFDFFSGQSIEKLEPPRETSQVASLTSLKYSIDQWVIG